MARRIKPASDAVADARVPPERTVRLLARPINGAALMVRRLPEDDHDRVRAEALAGEQARLLDALDGEPVERRAAALREWLAERDLRDAAEAHVAASTRALTSEQ